MNRSLFSGIILFIIVTHVTASIQLIDMVPAPSYTITKLIQDGPQTFDIEWALAKNVTQMSSNLSTLTFASSRVSSTTLWLPINTTTALSVLQLGSFLSPNETVLVSTRTDVHPFESVSNVTVNMPTYYTITLLERAFATPNCTTVYALISTKFMRPATLVVEISFTNGSLVRQFDASSLPIKLGLCHIWDNPSNDHVLVMMSGAGIISLKRDSFELIGIYTPSDGIFPFNIVDGAVLMDANTIVWSNVTRQTNLTELRIWNFLTQENSSSLLLTNKSMEELDLTASFIGIDQQTGNIWTTFMSFGPGTYLATSVIYHYMNASKTIHNAIRLGDWLGWVEADHSQVGALVMDDTLIVVTMNSSNFVTIQKFADSSTQTDFPTTRFYNENTLFREKLKLTLYIYLNTSF